MPQVVQHAQKQDVVERLHATEFIDFGDLVSNLRPEFAMRFAKILLFDVVDRDHLGSAALRFEGEPPVPRADIEDPFSFEAFRKGNSANRSRSSSRLMKPWRTRPSFSSML